MKLQARIDAMVELGNHLQTNDEYLNAIMQRTYHENRWFTIENQEHAVQAIASSFLDRQNSENWLSKYTILENDKKTVALVMAGNIPLVGFHDLLCVFMTGHQAQIKLSEKDKYLLPYLIKCLNKINPDTSSYFSIVEKLQGFDAIIAASSNNSARYFEAYFGKYPNIIRKNRNGIAVLDGSETQEELIALGRDVFQYFGLGCRNVSKIYVPKNYNFEPLLEALHEYRSIVLNTKYKNNFDYHYAIYIINRAKYLANGCIMLREEKAIASPISNLYYEYYESLNELVDLLKKQEEKIQLIVSKVPLGNLSTLPFGQAQQPSLSDYADEVDTMQFLTEQI